MQGWEYLYINRSRKPMGEKGWENTILTAAGESPFRYQSMAQALEKLGEEGWEMICVTPLLTDETFPGYSNGMVMYFKRPKE
jgi:hypothetical protein